MSEVCHDVSMEPSLESLSGELLFLLLCNQEIGACLDVSTIINMKSSVCKGEHASYSPLLFVMYKHFTFLLSNKWKKPHIKVMNWLLCIRDSRSSSDRPLRGHGFNVH